MKNKNTVVPVKIKFMAATVVSIIIIAILIGKGISLYTTIHSFVQVSTIFMYITYILAIFFAFSLYYREAKGTDPSNDLPTKVTGGLLTAFAVINIFMAFFNQFTRMANGGAFSYFETTIPNSPYPTAFYIFLNLIPLIIIAVLVGMIIYTLVFKSPLSTLVVSVTTVILFVLYLLPIIALNSNMYDYLYVELRLTAFLALISILFLLKNNIFGYIMGMITFILLIIILGQQIFKILGIVPLKLSGQLFLLSDFFAVVLAGVTVFIFLIITLVYKLSYGTRV